MERKTSKTRGNSCSSSQSVFMESTKLRGIFPDEVWLMILGNVIGWENYQQICKASQHLALLAKEQRTKILFSSVVDVLCKNWNAYSKSSQLQLLKWRKVCRSWKRGVDFSLQSFERHRQPLPFDCIRFFHYPAYSIPILCEYFESPEDIEKILEYFKHNSNPFQFRKITVRIEWSTDSTKHEKFISSILELLDKYGKYVWYFCLSLKNGDIPQKINSFKTLEQILSRTPNLKKLIFKLFNTPTLDLLQETRLKAYLSKRPYPLMPKLKSLESRTLPQAVLECLLQQAPKVTDIQIGCGMSSALTTNTFSDLNTLSCSFFKTSDISCLESLKQAWKVTQLEVDVSNLDLSWRKIFRVLENKFSDTLQKLSIRLPISPVLRIYGGLFLPNLKDLYLELKNFVPLDCLVPMGNTLEKLFIEMNVTHLYYPADEIHKHEEIVKFYQYRRILHRSNI